MTHVQTRHHSTHQATSLRVVLCVSTLTTCTLLSGCASEVPRYSPGIVVGDQGHSAEVVLESPSMLALSPDGAKSTYWRDDSLNIRPLPTEIARAGWPRHHRPSLDNVRRVNLRQQSDTILYFREEGYEYRSNRSRW